VGWVFLLGRCVDLMGDEMTLQERGKAMLLDELLGIVAEQDEQIERLRAKMRGALAALQTGAAVDVVAAIEILRGEK
tara:strand:- start:281 stop:511 length:231 start_codon:yes stop_codon:yes gene_type:complete